MCVQLSHNKPRSKEYILYNIYRRPNEIAEDINTFAMKLSSFLVKVNNLNRPAYVHVCGDYNIEASKYIEIERNDPRSMQNFVRELEELNIYDRLETPLNTNPQENYDTFLNMVNIAKNTHLPKKVVRFNEKKHKKAKWLTNEILQSINTKDTQYKDVNKNK